MKLIRSSLLAAAILAGVLSQQAALNLPTTTINGVKYYYYEVQPKESLYSLTHKLGVTRADIIRCNPSVVDGIKAKQTLLFPYAEFSGETEPVAQTPEAVAAPEESVVSAAEEQPVEPIPEPAMVLTTGRESIPATALVPAIRVEADTVVEAAADDALNIAVMLPFMLQKETMTRQADNYTEFYRGLLMAVDTLASQCDFPIHLYAYDTEDSAERVSELMSRPEMQQMTYIIAPEDSASVERIAAVADSLPDATVINLFSVHNGAFQRHESLIQANIPTANMYVRVIEAFVKEYAGCTPVILNSTDIKADKLQFTKALTEALVSAGIPYMQVDFEGTLDQSECMDFYSPDKPYVFVLTGASRELLGKILQPLQQMQSEAAVASNVRLFGYPDWIILTGAMADRLYALDATIYSRFAFDKNSVAAQTLLARYKEIYGRSVNKVAPIYGVLGYDTGRWLITAAENGIDAPVSGLQSEFSIKYVDPEEATGAYNNALYFVNFDTTHELIIKSL